MPSKWTDRLRTVHNRNVKTLRQNPLAELSGSLGDLGTLLPLMIALTLTGSISLSSTLVFSGLANIITGAVFGLPLPVQPMKAIAAIAIQNSYSRAKTASAGLFVGGVVLALSITGLIRVVGRVVPVAVVRGIQVGAGLTLVLSAGTSLLQPLGWTWPSWADNWLWAIFAFVFLLISSLYQRLPYALLITVLGLVLGGIRLANHHGSHWAYPSSPIWNPSVVVPAPDTFGRGALDAGLPQLPLTLLNSILAVTQLSADLFSSSTAPSLTALGVSVGLTNLIGPWFGAMPVCHGSGGLAGQYRFGARSGASVVILGLIKLLLGIFAGEYIVPLLSMFPRSLLGLMVIAAGVELAKVAQSLDDKSDIWEEADRDNEQAVGERHQLFGAKSSELDRKDRWTVMLVTVAGCLAFKNDAVGFIVGMVWHYATVLANRQRSRGSGLLGRHGESESLLGRNNDAPDGTVA